MELKLGEQGLRLVELYQETLNITINDAMNIISKNKAAQALLEEELALAITGVKKNLSALLSVTLLRDFYDFEPLKDSEKNNIKQIL